jgi:hypothetical protein
MYSSYSFTTSALDGGEWSASQSCRALPPGKGSPVPIVQEAEWAPETVWTEDRGKNSQIVGCVIIDEYQFHQLHTKLYPKLLPKQNVNHQQ